MAGRATPACVGSGLMSAPYKSECPGGAGHIATIKNALFDFNEPYNGKQDLELCRAASLTQIGGVYA